PLTLHVGASCADVAERALSAAARTCERVRLNALAIKHSGEFTKTLFVQFELSKKLSRLNEIIRSAAGDPFRYELKPHLSLLYKKAPLSTRLLQARSMELPFSTVIFDSLKAVRCVAPTQSRADVEAWRVVAAKRMSQPRFRLLQQMTPSLLIGERRPAKGAARQVTMRPVEQGPQERRRASSLLREEALSLLQKSFPRLWPRGSRARRPPGWRRAKSPRHKRRRV